MDKIKVGIIIAVLVLVGLAGLMVFRNSSRGVILDTGNLGDANEPLSGTITIEIKNSQYTKGKVTVKKGSTVTWMNRDATEHDVSPTKTQSVFQRSPMLARGESYSVTFSETGTFDYFCTPHPFMTGSVEVVE